MQKKGELKYFAMIAETGFILAFSEHKCRKLGMQYLRGRGKFISRKTFVETVDDVILIAQVVAGVILEPGQILPDKLILYRDLEGNSTAADM